MASYEDAGGGRVRAKVFKLGVRDSGTFPSKAAAKAWATIREGEIVAGAKLAKVKRGTETVRQMLERHRDEEAQRRDDELRWRWRCDWFLQHLPFVDLPVSLLSSDPIQDWADARERKVSASTVNRELNDLSSIFEHARKKWKWADHNPVHDVERPENPDARQRRVPEEDVDSMLEALGYVRGTPAVTPREVLAVAFLVALGTGMRKGEILKSKRAALREHHLPLPGAITKSRKPRDVALTPAVCELLQLLPQDHELLAGGLDVATADRLWRAARAKAHKRVHDLHFHDSRHEAVTQMALKLPILALAKQIGHSNLNSLKAYYNATPKEIAALLAG